MPNLLQRGGALLRGRLFRGEQEQPDCTESLDPMEQLVRNAFASELGAASADQARNRLLIERVIFQTRRAERSRSRSLFSAGSVARRAVLALVFVGGAAAASWGAARNWNADLDSPAASPPAESPTTGAGASYSGHVSPSDDSPGQDAERPSQPPEPVLRVAVEPSQPAAIVRRAVSAPLPGQAPNSAAHLSVAQETATSMFEHASELRRRGDVAQALVVYEQLQARFPQARETHLSHAIRGRLYLQSSQPARALKQFDAYLARGGGASQDALAGRANALEQLGRSTQERAAWSQLLERYPKSVHVERARQRLRALR